MVNSPNPYRESGIESSNVQRLSTEQVKELTKMIYREPVMIRKNESVLTVKEPYLENMLEYAGYRKLRDNTYIRQNQLISSFPEGSKLAEDKFTAVYSGFNKDEKIIVNGDITGNLESTLTDIDIMEEILAETVSYTQKNNTVIGVLSGTGMGIVVCLESAASSQIALGMFGVLCPFFGAALYTVSRRIKHDDAIGDIAHKLSENAAMYLFGATALRYIRLESSEVQDARKSLYYYEKLNSAGINLTPDSFCTLENTVTWYFCNGYIEDLKICLRKKFSDAQIETIIDVFGGRK